VREYTAQARLRAREMFVPLSHRPGHAQADFGEADGYIAGKKVRFHYFCMDLPHSDGCFVKAYPAETAEAFCDGHVAAFDVFGGVPHSILYDNTRLAVAKIVKGGRRLRSQIRGTAEPLPVQRPVWQGGQGQRQGQGGGRLIAARRSGGTFLSKQLKTLGKKPTNGMKMNPWAQTMISR
jgi:transposase